MATASSSSSAADATVTGPFRFAAPESREESADLLFLPEATAADWAKLFAQAEPVRVGAGLAIVQAGEMDRGLYLITEGTLAVKHPLDESAFKAIEAPAVVGELAFFDGLPRSATLEARTDVEAVRLDPAALDRLAAEEPELARTVLLDLARILALRLRMASDVIAELRG
jgi:CRP/FNR family transcriptional regulator, cyclic AMP receptor protein